MFRTAYSYVLEARRDQRSLMWFGYDSAHGTVWLPFYGASEIPAPKTHVGHGLNMSTFNTNAGWWAFNLINQYSDLNFKQINKEVRIKAAEIHEQAVEAVKQWESECSDLKQLAEHSNNFAVQQVEVWWDLAWKLIAKYGRLVVTYNESMQGVDYIGQMYPAWWLESPDVGFTVWAPKGPFIGIPDRWKFSNLASKGPPAQWLEWLVAAGAFATVYLLGYRHGSHHTVASPVGYVAMDP